MKTLLIAVLGLFLIASCGNSKNATDKVEDAQTEAADAVDNTEEDMDAAKEEATNADASGLIRGQGIVRDMSGTEGCGFLIEVTLEGKKKYLQPLSLDENLQIDGKAVKFTYRMSRRPSTCAICNANCS